jgi:hypothetical protein
MRTTSKALLLAVAMGMVGNNPAGAWSNAESGNWNMSMEPVISLKLPLRAPHIDKDDGTVKNARVATHGIFVYKKLSAFKEIGVIGKGPGPAEFIGAGPDGEVSNLYHAEGQAIGMLNKISSITEALLVINNAGGICVLCDRSMPSQLAEGKTLHVVWRDKKGVDQARTLAKKKGTAAAWSPIRVITKSEIANLGFSAVISKEDLTKFLPAVKWE